MKTDPLTGIAVGIGAIVLWPLASRVARPIVKEVVKAGIRLYHAGENVAAGVKEITAEAAAETTSGTVATRSGGERPRRPSAPTYQSSTEP